MGTEDNKALIRRYLEDVMNSHDAAACAALFAPDATNHGRPIGREGLRRVHEEIFRTFPDWHNTIEELVAEGEVVVTRNYTTATHVGAPERFNVHGMLGIAPTGEPVEMRSIHLMHLRDGLITSHAAVRDDLETLRQIGLWPPPGVVQGQG